MSSKKTTTIVVTHEWERSELLRTAAAGYAEAARRVGRDERSRLNWLLRFIYLSPEHLAKFPEREQIQWRYDLAHFAALPRTPDALPRLEEVARRAAELRNAIEHLTPLSHFTFKLPKDCTIKRTIEPRPVKRAGRTILVGFRSYYTSDDLEAAFLLNATDAIEAEGTRIRVCAQKDCERRFARHRRAKYCSSKCSQKERDARFRKSLSKAERKERRERHAKRRSKRLHAEALAGHKGNGPFKRSPKARS